MYSGLRSRCSIVPAGDPVGDGAAPFSAIARISRRPLSSPTGAAPGRQSFSPLYWGGLWLAVNIAPGRPRRPEAKYTMSVVARPSSTMPAPERVTPAQKASDRAGEESRQSRPSTTRSACTQEANAAPIRYAPSSSNSSG